MSLNMSKMTKNNFQKNSLVPVLIDAKQISKNCSSHVQSDIKQLSIDSYIYVQNDSKPESILFVIWCSERH